MTRPSLFECSRRFRSHGHRGLSSREPSHGDPDRCSGGHGACHQVAAERVSDSPKKRRPFGNSMYPKGRVHRLAQPRSRGAQILWSRGPPWRRPPSAAVEKPPRWADAITTDVGVNAKVRFRCLRKGIQRQNRTAGPCCCLPSGAVPFRALRDQASLSDNLASSLRPVSC